VHLPDRALEQAGADREVLEQPLDAENLLPLCGSLMERLDGCLGRVQGVAPAMGSSTR
jgi:hypothetical protein